MSRKKFAIFKKIYYNIYRKLNRKGERLMDTILVKALLTILAYCKECDDCSKCAFKDFCGKSPEDWLL